MRKWSVLAVVVIIICVSLAWILGHLVCLACGSAVNILIPVVSLVLGAVAGYGELTARA
jgi:hypothetical protein